MTGNDNRRETSVALQTDMPIFTTRTADISHPCKQEDNAQGLGTGEGCTDTQDCRSDGDDAMHEVLTMAREQFAAGVTRDVAFRKRQLQKLLRFYQENEQELTDALYRDLRKPREESVMTELAVVLRDCRTMIDNVHCWSRPQAVGYALATLLDRPYVVAEPRGLVLVMSAWNYPLQLALLPLSGAIAAGNCVVLKPSELAPATAALLAERLPRYLDARCYPVVCGGPDTCRRLLQQRFDYIFFTGSTAVGRLVREASNRHLTPVTLELGGKSPVYMDDSVNMDYAARRLLWGKTTNLGQTCIAPDYLLCDKATERRLVAAAERVLASWYGSQPGTSSSIGRLLNAKHFRRVSKLLSSSGRVALGGRCVEAENYIEPTILVDVQPDDPIMQEEIFGPVLPVVTVNSVDEAIHFINCRTPDALSLYIFSTRRAVKEQLIRRTSTGSVLCNDTMYHAIVEQLPFGGVGSSGMGAYHGHHSFRTFTHYKSVLDRGYSAFGELVCGVRYPPFGRWKLAIARFFLRNPAAPSLTPVWFLLTFVLGAATVLLIITLCKKYNWECRVLDSL